MKEFKDKVAVITGGASGIGRGLAERCVEEGITKIVLADVEEAALAKVSEELKAKGASVLAVRADVSKASEVEALAKKTLDAFGGAHLLFNNAGVGAYGSIWETSLEGWEWTVGVNLWGVVHGIRVFVPIMLAQDTECYIVNTASTAGLAGYNPSAAYQATKYAVVGLSENLYFSLKEKNAKIKTSVLCPSLVRTGIWLSERNRPAGMGTAEANADAIGQRYDKGAQERGMDPKQVADIVFDAMREEKFYIFTHPGSKQGIQARMENILAERNPS